MNGRQEQTIHFIQCKLILKFISISGSSHSEIHYVGKLIVFVKDFIIWHGIDRFSFIYIRRLDWSNIPQMENIHNCSISKQCMEKNWRFEGS